MKARHKDAIRTNALAFLAFLRIEVGQDFHTLSKSQVEGLLAEADRVRYQKPASANGSLARYFHARLSEEECEEIALLLIDLGDSHFAADGTGTGRGLKMQRRYRDLAAKLRAPRAALRAARDGGIEEAAEWCDASADGARMAIADVGLGHVPMKLLGRLETAESLAHDIRALKGRP